MKLSNVVDGVTLGFLPICLYPNLSAINLMLNTYQNSKFKIGFLYRNSLTLKHKAHKALIKLSYSTRTFSQV